VAERAGASRLYLQVETHNQGAMALYRHAGFRPVYTYHYRSADPSRGGGSRS